MLLVSCVILVAACKGKDKPEDTSFSGAAVAEPPTPTTKAAGCPFLAEAKVKEITGVAVTAHPHGNPQSCAMFQTPDGKDYLLVGSDSASSYKIFLESNSPKMFPLRTPIAGVGSEAILLRWNADPGSIRTLIAHNDDRTVVLTPAYNSPITDAQLTEIARASVAAP